MSILRITQDNISTSIDYLWENGVIARFTEYHGFPNRSTVEAGLAYNGDWNEMTPVHIWKDLPKDESDKLRKQLKTSGL